MKYTYYTNYDEYAAEVELLTSISGIEMDRGLLNLN